MVDVIQSFRYKTAGRGRGVLGLSDVISSRRPGEKMAPLPATSETPDTSARSSSAAITAERASRKTDEGGDAGKKENSSRSGGEPDTQKRTFIPKTLSLSLSHLHTRRRSSDSGII